MNPEPLEIVPEDWDRALAIVAHPDDMEYGAAAAVARWTAQGKTVVYTPGHQRRGRDRRDGAGRGAARCGRRSRSPSAAVVGVDVVEFLGGADGMLEYGLPLRREPRRRDPPAPARHRDHRQLPGDVRTGHAQPGRPHRGRPGRPRRGPRRRRTAGCSGSCSTRGWSRGAVCARCSPRAHRSRPTGSTSPSTLANGRRVAEGARGLPGAG